MTAILTGVAAQAALRPHLARSHPARRRRRVHRRSGRLRDASLHADQAPARAHARSRVGRQRPDGDRAHARSDRVDREPRDATDSTSSSCSSSVSSGSGLLVGVVLAVAATWVFARLPRAVGPVRTRRIARRGRTLLRSCGRRSGVAASSPCTSSASPSAARRRAIAGSSSASTKDSRSSHRSRCSSCSACSCSHASSRTSRARGSRSRCCSCSSSAPSRSGCRPRSTTSRRASGSCSGGQGCRGAVPIVLATFVLSSRGRRTRTRSSTPSSSSSSSRRSCKARHSNGSPDDSTSSHRLAPTHEPPIEVGESSHARPSRLRRRARSRDRGSRRPRGRPAADRDHRRGRARRRLDPAARQHDHRARRPPVRPRTALGSRRGRGRLLALAPKGLAASTLARCRRSSTSSTATARSSPSRRSTAASACTSVAYRHCGSRVRSRSSGGTTPGPTSS